MLRVGDTVGWHGVTGDVIHVDQRTIDTGFEAATDPGAGVSPVAALRNAVSGLYWNVRTLF